MDVPHLCTSIKQKIGRELEGIADPAAREEILIDALYDLSRVVLPALGVPKKGEEYLEQQAAVLDLITFLAIPLIRGAYQKERGVTVLSEIGEGCQDPLLKKKLSVYAQELLAKASSGASAGKSWSPASLLWVPAAAAVALLVYLAWPGAAGLKQAGGNSKAASPQVATQQPLPQAAPNCPTPVQAAQEQASARQPAEPEAGRGGPGAEAAGGAALRTAPAPGEKVATRVRIVNNQVLVPVILKNKGGTVRVELILDTGASRTTIHEGIVAKLPIDLKSAKSSEAIVADGRVIRSRIAKIDSLVVGPFAVPSMELELIPFHGADSPHDGLLGMDFLGKHRYQIDMEHELIRWF